MVPPLALVGPLVLWHMAEVPLAAVYVHKRTEAWISLLMKLGWHIAMMATRDPGIGLTKKFERLMGGRQ